MVNPFRPSAGANPPYLIGRDALLDEFDDSLEAGPGAPYRLMRITGSRGSGKTVLLNALGKRARARRWTVIDETATHGFVGNLILALRAQYERRDVKSVELPSLGVDGLGSVGLGKVEFDRTALPMTLRTALTNAVNHIGGRHADRGLLITIDETQGADVADLRALATAVQHLIREERNIAVAFAGLPGMTSSLLHDNVITFLRRATPVELGDISLDLVSDAFEDVIHEHGYDITPDALRIATEATHGYPFMVQLVGYNIWRKALGATIDENSARNGVEAARLRLGGTVHEPAIEDLSSVDRTYLLAMAQDEGPSRTGDIARRIGKDTQYAGRYRERLIQAGIIHSSSYGYVDFTIPYLRQWLQEHAATLIMRSE
ncbi:AAA ATPase [Bifidobacterium margollesii]|uniref:AAA ATPase n=1 Tax=Bifidobacterium margollesii TaxID=2020964 RepID=A0A2N5J9Q0_9BIFI|nr:ATP-binding protein [Bifidobacterium margollesii]PLS30925.1 AAA ATPase [Bifidobacterium margollesii]